MKKLLFIAITLCLPYFLIAQNSKVDSLISEISKADEKQKASLYFDLGNEYYNIKELEKSSESFIKSGQLSIKYDSTEHKRISECYNFAAYNYDLLGQYDNAIMYGKIALDLSIKYNLLSDISANSSNLGQFYIKIADYEKAANYFEISLNIDLKSKDSSYLSTSFHNLAYLYMSWGKMLIALDYAKKAYNVDYAMNDSAKMAIRLSSIGVAFRNMEQYDSALYYTEKALEIDLKGNDEKKIAIRKSNLAKILFHMKLYKRSEQLFLEAIGIFEKNNINHSIAISGNQLAELYFDRGKFFESEKYYKIAAKTAKKIDHKVELATAYMGLSKIYDKRKDFEKALDYYKLSIDLKDQINKKNNLDSQMKWEVRYNTQKQSSEIQILKQSNQISELKLKRSKNERILLIISILSLLIAGIIIYNRLQLRKRTNELLRFKNKQLKLLNDAKDRFFRILSHDLKNPLSAISSLSSSLNTSFNSFSNSEVQKFISEIDEASSNIYGLLENLLLWAKTQFYGISIDKKYHNLHELISDSIKPLIQTAKIKNIVIDILADKNLTVYADHDIFKIVLMNLITNAIKFTNKNGTIYIKSETYSNGIKIIVEDNGIGISDSDLSKLFKPEMHGNSIGNSKEKGTGLGLLICRELIEECNEEIYAESKLESGSKFIFTLSNKA